MLGLLNLRIADSAEALYSTTLKLGETLNPKLEHIFSLDSDVELHLIGAGRQRLQIQMSTLPGNTPG